MALFRPQAIENKRRQLIGDVHIPTNVSYTALSTLALLFLLLIVVLGLFGDYSKNERVVGHLVPTKGLVKIQATRPGTIAKLFVQEGAVITRGSPLVSIDTAFIGGAGQSLQQLGIETLVKHLDLLRQRRKLEQSTLQADMRVFAAKKRISERNLQTLESGLLLQEELTLSAKESYLNAENNRRKGFIRKIEFEDRRQQYIQAQQQMGSMRQEIASAKNVIDELTIAVEQRQIKFAQTSAGLDAEVLSLKQRQVEVESELTFSLLAPVDGTVTSILSTVGKSIRASEPLITLLPKGSALQAELFVPSRAIGFIEVGQKVKLAYDAFPYQQYGTYSATITSVTRTMLLPDEINTGYPIQEPAYRVFAKMNRSEIRGGDNPIALRPGMRLDATIVLESLTLFGWMMQSIKGLGGRA